MSSLSIYWEDRLRAPERLKGSLVGQIPTFCLYCGDHGIFQLFLERWSPWQACKQSFEALVLLIMGACCFRHRILYFFCEHDIVQGISKRSFRLVDCITLHASTESTSQLRRFRDLNVTLENAIGAGELILRDT